MVKPAQFPQKLVQEMRNVVAVVTRESCMSDKASGATVDGQKEFQEKLFHGSAGYASVLTKYMEGKGDAACMFNKLPIENNREGNEERAVGSSSYMLQMKDIFSCDIGK
jgi:hypothetical protein